MTWVKICGITNLEDALIAVEAGADAVGFVFHDKSSRNMKPQAVGTISKELPVGIDKVGVFVNHPEDPVALAWQAQLTAFQFHMMGILPASGTSPSKALGMGAFPRPPKYFVALPASKLIDGSLQINFSLSPGVTRISGVYDTVFLDSGTSVQPGGTGIPFDWHAATSVVGQLKEQVNVVIAGGLSPANVREAIDLLHPWGVDVCSGVEASPGKKDPEKVRAFIKAVREADKANSRN